MRYFVTGATGFLGGALVRQLRTEGHEVVAIVRDLGKAAPLEALGIELAQGDVTEPGTLRGPMMGADGVFHVAAWYQVGADNSRAEAINVGGTRNVLETMRALEIPKGVYTSSVVINSDTRGMVVDETYRFEGEHLSAYDETKWRAHYEVAVPLIEQGLPLVIVMPGVIYGPGDTSQLGALLRDAVAGKRLVVPKETGGGWTYIDDVVRGHILAMEKGEVGEAYILSGPPHSWQDAIEMAGRITGRPNHVRFVPPGLLRSLAPVMGVIEHVLPVPDDYRSETLRVSGGTTYFGDGSKAERELGLTTRSLEEGLRATFASA